MKTYLFDGITTAALLLLVCAHVQSTIHIVIISIHNSIVDIVLLLPLTEKQCFQLQIF